MNKNVITQFESSEIKKIVEPILQNMDLAELTIKNYEEFFHALIHVKPKLFSCRNRHRIQSLFKNHKNYEEINRYKRCSYYGDHFINR